jgi:hypothetical protein
MQPWWKRWFGLLLAASPAFGALWLILHYGVDFHFIDEWDPDIGGVFVKELQHQLTFADLIAQHNEHRIFIPRLIYLAINPFTHWNNVQNQIVAWGIVCATSLLVLWLIRRTNPDGPFIFAWFLCNVMIFTPAQQENWLWGIGLANFAPTLFVFAALLAALARFPLWLRITLCAIFASAATYSSGNGILAWPLAGVLLIWPNSREEWLANRKTLAIWVIAFAVIVAFYFVGYVRPTHGGFHIYSMNPAAIVAYNLAFMGSPFAYCSNWGWDINATTIGSVLLLMYLGAVASFLYFWKKDQQEVARRMLPWLVVGGFGILSGLMSSFFRAGLGTEQAVHSRYVTYALYLPVSLVILLPMNCLELKKLWPACSRQWTQLPWIAATALLALQMGAVPRAMDESRTTNIQYREGRGALMLLDCAPDDIMLASAGLPHPKGFYETANSLSDFGYINPPILKNNNAFAISRTNNDSTEDVLGQLEGLKSTPDGKSYAYGWAVFPKQFKPAECVFLTYQDADHQPIIFAGAHVGARRDDVVATLTNPDFQFAGWEAEMVRTHIDPSLQQTDINAWVLDVDTGKATKLDGVLTFKR